MPEIAAVAFTSFFATVGPIEAAAIFVGIPPNKTAALRRTLAIRGFIISAEILLSFALFGQFILTTLGIVSQWSIKSGWWHFVITRGD